MSPSEAARQLDDLARELDLLVYRIEVAEREQTHARTMRKLWRELEHVRDRLQDLARELDR